MSPFIHGLVAGFFIGVGTCGAFVLHRLQRRPKMPTTHRRRINGWQPVGTRMSMPPMPRVKPARDADFWDIARQNEPGRVQYEFLGMTGQEQE